MLLSHSLGIISDVNNNIIINGNFDVWQRSLNETITEDTLYPPTLGHYTCDRFGFDANFSVGHETLMERDWDRPDYALCGCRCDRSLHITNKKSIQGLNNDDYSYIGYIIEGHHLSPLIAMGSGTLSFWIKSNKPGIYTLTLGNAMNTYDGFVSYMAEYTIHQANTWEKKIVQFPFTPASFSGNWYYDNYIGMRIFWILDAGTSHQMPTINTWGDHGVTIPTSNNQTHFYDAEDNYWKISLVKLEPGDIVTPFVPKNRDEEYERCLRYFEVYVMRYDVTHTGWSAAKVRGIGKFNIRKRSLPLIEQQSGTVEVWKYAEDWHPIDPATQLSYYAVNEDDFIVLLTNPAGYNTFPLQKSSLMHGTFNIDAELK